MEIKEQRKADKLIKLSNRYKDKNYLRQIGDKEYKYEGDSDYLRIGYSTDDKYKIEFIDPSGGPFLSVGSEVFGIEGKITEINKEDKTFILKFE
jgi:hypothetical protein